MLGRTFPEHALEQVVVVAGSVDQIWAAPSLTWRNISLQRTVVSVFFSVVAVVFSILTLEPPISVPKGPFPLPSPTLPTLCPGYSLQNSGGSFATCFCSDKSRGASLTTTHWPLISSRWRNVSSDPLPGLRQLVCLSVGAPSLLYFKI